MSLSTLFARPSTDKDIPLLPLHATHCSSSSPNLSRSTTKQPPFSSKMTLKATPIPQSDALLTFSRQEAHLQSTLQQLLDAQSEGLLAGLGAGSSQDEISSAGSRTSITEPDFGFQRSKTFVPPRQPGKKRLGLQGARKGIARTITALSSLKSEEVGVLEDEVTKQDDLLFMVEGFEQKSTGLQDQIREIESEESSKRVADLKQEEQALGSDIHQLETKLYEMKARHRHLLLEIDGLNSRVQSKLSSYQSALAMTQKDIRAFLARPPMDNTSATTTGIWTLPKERRTLEMAKEDCAEKQQSLQRRCEDVQAEITALDNGSAIWKEVVDEVTAVEQALRTEMQNMQTPSSKTTKGPVAARSAAAAQGMQKILQMMQTARALLESKLDHAETRNWRLLIVCIGAELEALSEGQSVLEGALESSRKVEQKGKQRSQDGAGFDSSQRNGGAASTIEDGPLIDDTALGPSSHDDSSPARGFLEGCEDEDEGPGPELLISQHDG